MKTTPKLILATIALVLALLPAAHAQIGSGAAKALLEKYCKEHYDDCFPGRKYLEGSLTVTSIDLDGTTVKIKGRHNYTGYLGKTYTDIDYKADITYNGTDIAVTFYKWFVPAVKLIDGHWESCEKHINWN